MENRAPDFSGALWLIVRFCSFLARGIRTFHNSFLAVFSPMVVVYLLPQPHTHSSVPWD